MPTFLALCFMVTAVLHADAPKEAGAIKQELARLQGQWQMIGAEAGGEKIDLTGERPYRANVQGDRLTISRDKEKHVFLITINPKSNPKHVDLLFVEGEYKGKTNHAIYSLINGELWLGFNTKLRPNDSTERPPDFQYRLKEDGCSEVFVFKSAKK